MDRTSTLKVALRLTAETSAASAKLGKFFSKTSAQFKALEKSARSINAAGTRNLVRGAALAAPLALAAKSAVDLEASVADIAKVLPER